MQKTRQISLDDDLVRRIESLAREMGATPHEVIDAAFEEFHARRNGGSQSGNGTAFDAFQAAGVIGTIDDGPGDKSTNPKYFDGFGRG